jgi:NAD-dependent dihydropyrimidine dehydrogenase PreA subunit
MKFEKFSLWIIPLIILCFIMSLNFSFAEADFFYDDAATIQELAEKNGLNTRHLIDELSLEHGKGKFSKSSLAGQSGLNRIMFEKQYRHLRKNLEAFEFVGLGIWIFIGGLVFWLLRKKKLKAWMRITVFLSVIGFFGFFLHGSPSAMESIVKFFKFTAGKENFYPGTVLLVFFTLFGLVAPNLFCGTGCQIGVVQDFIFQLNKLTKNKYWKIPFVISNSIRTVLFLLSLLFMYDVLVGLASPSLYHDLNIFKFFSSSLTSIGIIVLIVTVLLSFVVYRPFCSLICPFGLWSWFLSNFSFYKIRVNHDECINCMKCVKACPNNAMSAILAKGRISRDCFVCGECLKQCPVDCIEFKK